MDSSFCTRAAAQWNNAANFLLLHKEKQVWSLSLNFQESWIYLRSQWVKKLHTAPGTSVIWTINFTYRELTGCVKMSKNCTKKKWWWSVGDAVLVAEGVWGDVSPPCLCLVCRTCRESEKTRDKASVGSGVNDAFMLYPVHTNTAALLPQEFREILRIQINFKPVKNTVQYWTKCNCLGSFNLNFCFWRNIIPVIFFQVYSKIQLVYFSLVALRFFCPDWW